MLFAIFIFVVCGIGFYSLLQAIKKAPMLEKTKNHERNKPVYNK